MAKTTITKLATGILHYESCPGYPFNIRSKGHKVQKHISDDQVAVAGMSLHSVDCPVSGYLLLSVTKSFTMYTAVFHYSFCHNNCLMAVQPRLEVNLS